MVQSILHLLILAGSHTEHAPERPSASDADPRNLPDELLTLYRRHSEVYRSKPTWEELEEDDLWQELCFCILSSNVPYQMAASATLQLSQKGLLGVEGHGGVSFKLIAFELSRPVYRPERRDGALRVYRFPGKRAREIVGAWKYLYAKNSGLTSLLQTRLTPSNLRMSMVSNIPGIGLKEASHFLRNVKYTNSLAVLDSHTMAFLNLFVQPLPQNYRLTPDRYIQLEELLVKFAENLSLCPAVLDMAIWEYMKSS